MSDSENSSPQVPNIQLVFEQLRAGKPVIVTDSTERENEGDFIVAAESITPQIVKFLLRYGSGELCVSLPEEVAERLQLNPIVGPDENTAPNQTQFLIPVDHKDSGSGVSAEFRALTIRALSDEHSQASDFVRPGHIHPLLAKQGGILRRAGHTEATGDLLQMAGLKPVGVLIEILSQKGFGMADADELREISDQFDIPIISTAEVIRHRYISEKLVHREVEVPIKTKKYGTVQVIGYSVEHESQQPVALVWGNLSATEAPLVRMHSSCFTGDLLDSLRCDCGDQLHMAMEAICQEKAGAVVYLPQEGRGIGLIPKLKAYVLQDEGLDTVEANLQLGFKADSRDFTVGVQILKDLGLTKVRLLTNNPKKTDSDVYTGFDLEVVEQVPIVAPPHKDREFYLQTKRDKMGHILPTTPAD
ncbi:GTP cyclohydrolase II [Gimesia aquarii]|uniref:GTP cyclohydrolase-2 n=1 Tax=Gimesia aquarii TaxID=2527964 RepID=A0A517W1F9_9PLAN|nr:GTP cyclohydrolase II [Gimesia aquarii]QDT99089.1 Riboflavin biosynthesis protein RibBA [Gimesia aquarii]